MARPRGRFQNFWYSPDGCRSSSDQSILGSMVPKSAPPRSIWLCQNGLVSRRWVSGIADGFGDGRLLMSKRCGGVFGTRAFPSDPGSPHRIELPPIVRRRSSGSSTRALSFGLRQKWFGITSQRSHRGRVGLSTFVPW